MRFSINIPNFGDFADPRTVAKVAAEAEQAGWDGLFVWDHVVHRKRERAEQPFGDPWILLTAAALATSRLRLGTLLTPVARRRPEQLARQVATLDSLSDGRVTFAAGLGAPIEDEFGSFGDATDPVVLAGRLDEGLELLARYWSGEQVSHDGEHYQVHEVQIAARDRATSPPADLDRWLLAAPPAHASSRTVGWRRPAVRDREARTGPARRSGPRSRRVRPSASRWRADPIRDRARGKDAG
jgi:alkanesulfonate monooxygenase SsuD/methylene tetrahydromethanopterin reductase-like flavin-dependent oxidoreductase (luciferase family)